jgi:hypothetical protein
MELQCLGAAGRVTGSCHLLQDIIWNEYAAAAHVAQPVDRFDLAKPVPFKV